MLYVLGEKEVLHGWIYIDWFSRGCLLAYSGRSFGYDISISVSREYLDDSCDGFMHPGIYLFIHLLLQRDETDGKRREVLFQITPNFVRGFGYNGFINERCRRYR